MGETAAAERGRLARARDTVEQRRKDVLLAVIAESRHPMLERFDWAGWRANRAALVDALRSRTYWSERTRKAVDRAERSYPDTEHASDELVINRAFQRFEPGHPRVEMRPG